MIGGGLRADYIFKTLASWKTADSYLKTPDDIQGMLDSANSKVLSQKSDAKLGIANSTTADERHKAVHRLLSSDKIDKHETALINIFENLKTLLTNNGEIQRLATEIYKLYNDITHNTSDFVKNRGVTVPTEDEDVQRPLRGKRIQLIESLKRLISNENELNDVSARCAELKTKIQQQQLALSKLPTDKTNATNVRLVQDYIQFNIGRVNTHRVDEIRDYFPSLFQAYYTQPQQIVTATANCHSHSKLSQPQQIVTATTNCQSHSHNKSGLKETTCDV